LARHFLESCAQKYQRPELPWAADFTATLKSHAWPGNVRELRNAMERLAVMATGPNLSAEDFQRYCLSPDVEESADTEPLSLAEAERLAIERALSACDGNKTQAARLLGITPKTLSAKLALYNKA
jgi:DNA-binding NtrC family response regulator